MANDTADILRKARALVERGWTRNSYAKNKAGQRTSPTAPGACRWCMTGALSAASGKSPGEIPESLWAPLKAATAIVEIKLHHWNDAQRDKRPVLAAFDRAIALAEQEPANG